MSDLLRRDLEYATAPSAPARRTASREAMVARASRSDKAEQPSLGV